MMFPALVRLLRFRSFGGLLLLVAAAGPIPAADLGAGRILVSDSTDDRILALEDLDGSGTFDGSVPGEVTVWFDGAGTDFALSVPSGIAIGIDGFPYVLDGGTLDAILRAEDRNGDGDVSDPGEVSVFYDATGDGPSLGTPNTLLPLADGSWLLADDGSRARHVVRLVDLDGDGDALDAGEAAVAFDATNADGTAIEDPESLAVVGDVVYVGDSTAGAVFALRDLDGDGAYQSAGESSVFYRSGEPHVATDLDAIVPAGDAAIFLVDEDTGLVLRLEDRDGDGRAFGSVEATIFIDVDAPLRVRDPNDASLHPSGALLLADGSTDAVYLARDLDGDGAIRSEGEIERLLLDDGENLATPSALTWWPRAGEPEPVIRFVRGDANSDGSVDIADPTFTLSHLFLGSDPPHCLDASDTDDSGEVNISDPIASLNFLFLGGPAPLPPHPAPGIDPTADELSCESGLD